MIQKRQERQNEAEHQCQREQAAGARVSLRKNYEQKAIEQCTAPKPQLLERPTLDTETTPDNYDLLMAKCERYRDGCLKPHNQDQHHTKQHPSPCRHSPEDTTTGGYNTLSRDPTPTGPRHTNNKPPQRSNTSPAQREQIPVAP